MKKANKPAGVVTPAQKRPAQKKLATKPAGLKNAQRAAGLAEVVALLAVSAKQLAQAADRLAEATARLSVTGEARHEPPEMPGRSPGDLTKRDRVADVTDGE